MVAARGMQTASWFVGAEARGSFLDGARDLERKMNEMLDRWSRRYSANAGATRFPQGPEWHTNTPKRIANLAY